MLVEDWLDGLRVTHIGASRVPDPRDLVRSFQQVTVSIVIADPTLPARPLSNDAGEVVACTGSQTPMHDG
jgi:hypothetical protein